MNNVVKPPAYSVATHHNSIVFTGLSSQALPNHCWHPQCNYSDHVENEHCFAAVWGSLDFPGRISVR